MNYLLFLALIALNSALKFSLTLGPEEQRCFYQVLATQQKYAIDVIPQTDGAYELDVKHQENEEWLHSVTRKTNKSRESIRLYKLASKEALYSFCLINSARQNLTAKIELRWGLELLDLKVLAQQSDQQALQRQARWIDKRADKIIEIINNSKDQMANKQQLQNIMSYKLIGFAVFGVLTVVIINLYFYFSIRKTFRDRKMI